MSDAEISLSSRTELPDPGPGGGDDSIAFTPAQRGLALAMGVVCHAAFGAGVVAMALGLYTGMRSSHGALTGWGRIAVNGLLLAQFALSHSFFLSKRGRRWLERTVPLGIGREVATTVFVTVSSLQLLATFWWWSPGLGTAWQPHGLAAGMMAALYAASWLLLLKSMKDAGLSVQIGYLGWHAVWRNRRPDYGGMPEKGLFRFSRQPIYAAFALILWTGPVWTLDHLVIALAWTAYCIGGPRFKERRYRQRYGEAFDRYQDKVPYFIPSPAQAGRELVAGISRSLAVIVEPEMISSGASPGQMRMAKADPKMKAPLKLRDQLDAPDTKREFNEELFTEVAPRYDLITRLLSLGRDGAWKRYLVRQLPDVGEDARPECVDLACGTGDLIGMLAERYPGARVRGLDLTEGMLALARERFAGNEAVSFEQRDMMKTELASDSVDIVTGGYALRNAPDLSAAMREIHRILKPGGTAAFLDFSRPPSSFLTRLEYVLLKAWGSLWGLILHGNADVYGYIADSLARYPDRDELRKQFLDAGFEECRSRRFFLGIVEVIVIRKRKRNQSGIADPRASVPACD